MGLVLEWDFDQYGEDECFMAIHSSLAPCKFVYWLNKELDICFSRAPEELNDKVSRSLFPLFIYQRETLVCHIFTYKFRTFHAKWEKAIPILNIPKQ